MNSETVTVFRANVYDPDSFDENPGFVEHHKVRGVIVAPDESKEFAKFASTTLTVWELYCPAGCDIQPTDQVVVRGLRWDVTGVPSEWRSPWSSWVPGVKVSVTRTTG